MAKKPHTLAIVEDDASLRDILTEIVNGSSWKLVTVYSNAESALEGFAKSCPEVVLMDIQLPGMSGIQCVAKLKELHPSVLVLMVTEGDRGPNLYGANPYGLTYGY